MKDPSDDIVEELREQEREGFPKDAPVVRIPVPAGHKPKPDDDPPPKGNGRP